MRPLADWTKLGAASFGDVPIRLVGEPMRLAPFCRPLRYAVATAGLLLLTADNSSAAKRAAVPAATPPPPEIVPEPLKLPDSQLEPIDFARLEGWAAEDHAAAFATFLASCRPLVRTTPSDGEARPMYFALRRVCQQALAAGRLGNEPARHFFERNFRPLRVSRLGESTGLLTGYYEPIVDGSRFPTPIFKVPIYRRPPDLVPPANSTGPGFPNRGQSLRRTSSGEFVPYYDRGEILDGALDGQHLEICWIKEQTDALLIQIEGSARIRLEDGTILRINYDAHNGYPYVPLSRILVDRNVIPREELSLARIRDWMRSNPQEAEDVRRQNRSFMFFRITGLGDERDAIGAQGIRLTPGRSIAVDRGLHVYGTPFFIKAAAPLAGDKRKSFDRLMIAQDTGSAIRGPARADIFFGAGDQAGQLAGRTHHPGSVAMLVPREIDPVVAGARMPLPPERPPALEATASLRSQKKLPGVRADSRHFSPARACRTCPSGAGRRGGANQATVGRRGGANQATVGRALSTPPKALKVRRYGFRD